MTLKLLATRSSIETCRARERLRNGERRGNNFEGPLFTIRCLWSKLPPSFQSCGAIETRLLASQLAYDAKVETMMVSQSM
jgi:hypothetical protein